MELKTCSPPSEGAEGRMSSGLPLPLWGLIVQGVKSLHYSKSRFWCLKHLFRPFNCEISVFRVFDVLITISWHILSCGLKTLRVWLHVRDQPLLGGVICSLVCFWLLLPVTVFMPTNHSSVAT